jgi:hypothetical protein
MLQYKVIACFPEDPITSNFASHVADSRRLSTGMNICVGSSKQKSIIHWARGCHVDACYRGTSTGTQYCKVVSFIEKIMGPYFLPSLG